MDPFVHISSTGADMIWNITVRQAWVDKMKGVLVNLPDMRQETDDTLRIKLLDPDEKIRAGVCKLYGQLDYETVLHHVSAAQLQAVAGRGLDKKVSSFIWIESIS